VTAQVVKPVNRDDLPALPNVENLKKSSLLGIDHKEGRIDGPTGFITKPSATTSGGESLPPAAPAKVVTPPVADSAKPSAPGVSLVVAPPVPAAKTTPNQ
ncbi:MAG TPA: hypothetical protein VHR36_09085, partial [Pyrinomonadaceae bacterium]|nr:hypothetical protein [Pyrinomonadaceae bacterium]